MLPVRPTEVPEARAAAWEFRNKGLSQQLPPFKGTAGFLCHRREREADVLVGGEGRGGPSRGLCYLGKRARHPWQMATVTLLPHLPRGYQPGSPAAALSPALDSVGLPGSSLGPDSGCWVCPFPGWASHPLFVQ